jgi:hypothetical protein
VTFEWHPSTIANFARDQRVNERGNRKNDLVEVSGEMIAVALRVRIG